MTEQGQRNSPSPFGKDAQGLNGSIGLVAASEILLTRDRKNLHTESVEVTFLQSRDH
jgi:hypothetical protein